MLELWVHHPQTGGTVKLIYPFDLYRLFIKRKKKKKIVRHSKPAHVWRCGWTHSFVHLWIHWFWLSLLFVPLRVRRLETVWKIYNSQELQRIQRWPAAPHSRLIIGRCVFSVLGPVAHSLKAQERLHGGTGQRGVWSGSESTSGWSPNMFRPVTPCLGQWILSTRIDSSQSVSPLISVSQGNAGDWSTFAWGYESSVNRLFVHPEPFSRIFKPLLL